jgi:hypothetical protein
MTIRIHGVDTHWGNLVYCQRPADDRTTFNDNWDKIFGKKDPPEPVTEQEPTSSIEEQN